MIVLAVSPHLDDAAFSAGATLATLARAGCRVVVATVFTASVPDPGGFALACQLDKGLGREADYMALRRAEDVAACAELGAEPVHLPFREAPHRGYGSAPELFADLRADDEAAAHVAVSLQAFIDELAPDLILAPQAIGGHVDHVQVVRALDLVQSGPPIAWWRDFPYAVRGAGAKQPFAARFDALPEIAAPVSAADARLRACLCYASQLGFQFGGVEGLRRRLSASPPFELFRSSTSSTAPAPLRSVGRVDRKLSA